jgi:DNA-binding LytR/AlgR family response regulator
MTVVIIEDEVDAYKRLQKLVRETFEATEIVHLDSVQSAKQWFATRPAPHVLFLDINLGDGTGFDVLNTINIDCPYVFTTAYDEYAIEAFQTNSIAYLLKPVSRDDLKAVLKKISDFHRMFTTAASQELQLQADKPRYKKRFIIRYGDHIKTLSVEEIAYCFSLNGVTNVRTFEGRTYMVDYKLEVLEDMLDPEVFFRINRKYLASLKAIEDMKTHTKGRIIITLRPPEKEQQVVSAERVTEFKQWLAGEL